MANERFLHANGITIAYDEFGDPWNPVIVLITGLGLQMISWPAEFCEHLARSGFRVIRFDNRDIGWSEKMEGQQAPDMMQLAMAARFGFPVKVPYTLTDMAQDTVGVLDALGIEAAHLVGASMGGMISQIVAGKFPDRVLSLTSIMSTSGAWYLPAPDHKVTRQMIKSSGAAPGDDIADAIATWRLIESPGYRLSDSDLRAQLTAAFERSFYPAGYFRQIAAILASGDRIGLLRRIRKPALVIHGANCLFGFSPDLARCTEFFSCGYSDGYPLRRKIPHNAQSLGDNSKNR